jgi:hypothetical protein
MKHTYLFTLEITPLEVGRVYDELPSHLTLMSRFLSNLSPEELAAAAQPFFVVTIPVNLVFGETIQLGPKKVTAHMVRSSGELKLHDKLQELLGAIKVEHQYPEFIGGNHKPHVTEREGAQFAPGSKHVASVAYLIEVVDEKRVIRAKFELSAA